MPSFLLARLRYAPVLLLAALAGCGQRDTAPDTTTAFAPDAGDYDGYLADEDRRSLAKAEEAIAFWGARLGDDTSGVGSIAPAAGGYGARFAATGDVRDLARAERLLRQGYAKSATGKDAFARQLAANLISQHRFAEAREVLRDVETIDGQPILQPAQDAVWFDVLMELGEYEAARAKLGDIRDVSDFNYLIREAKWQDYQGDLDEAIDYLERARARAESSDNSALRVWSYTNIGDFYGHAGRIEDAYRSYLAALELEPDNAYAKKSLAWIHYAHAGDLAEANRLLDAVMADRRAPDYHLLKAELAEAGGDEAAAREHLAAFESAATDPAYGDMYNTHLVEHWVEDQPARALELAQREVARRDTPETRQLLALAQYHAGEREAALRTLEEYVVDKTSEPMALLHAAQVYKATGQHPDRLGAYKQELLGAEFELGPATYAEVEAL